MLTLQVFLNPNRMWNLVAPHTYGESSQIFISQIPNMHTLQELKIMVHLTLQDIFFKIFMPAGEPHVISHSLMLQIINDISTANVYICWLVRYSFLHWVGMFITEAISPKCFSLSVWLWYIFKNTLYRQLCCCQTSTCSSSISAVQRTHTAACWLYIGYCEGSDLIIIIPIWNPSYQTFLIWLGQPSVSVSFKIWYENAEHWNQPVPDKNFSQTAGWVNQG